MDTVSWAWRRIDHWLATPADLAYVRRMMLDMDPPEHSRLRALLAKAFTPRAVARLVDRIRQRAGALVDAVAERGEVDFAKEIAADLPLLTLADVFGIPESDRWLMFDWSNRVIGYQDAEYAVSASFDATAAVLERMDDLELAGEPTRLRSNFQNGLKHLPIRWRRR